MLADRQKQKLNLMSNKNTNKEGLKVVANKMSDAGVEFWVGDIEGGMLILNSNEVVKYVEDRAQFFADKYKVSTETVREYEVFTGRYSDRHCAVIVRNGRHCKNPLPQPKTLKEFSINRLEYCSLHGK